MNIWESQGNHITSMETSTLESVLYYCMTILTLFESMAGLALGIL